MEPEIVHREAELAIGMGGSFKEGQTEAIGELWQKFVSRRDEIKSMKEYELGVCMPVHPEIEKKPDDSFVYIAAVPVSSIKDVPPGMVACELPAGSYAKFTHRGPIAEIKSTIEFIWGTWAPRSGYELRDTPDFELYDQRFDSETLSGEVDIYVPVKA